jgi:hypothetical protein
VNLVMTRLAASICLADIQCGSSAFNPNPPKLTAAFWVALPPRWDLVCAFLYLVFFGINI